VLEGSLEQEVSTLETLTRLTLGLTIKFKLIMRFLKFKQRRDLL